MNETRSSYKKKKYYETLKKKRRVEKEKIEKLEKFDSVLKENEELKEKLLKMEEEIKFLKERNEILEKENENLKKNDEFIEKFQKIKKDEEFRKLCGLELEDFIEVRNKIEGDMNLKNKRNKKRKNISFKEGRFDNETMLFITLLWIKHYPKNSLITFFLQISKFHLNLILKKTLKSLKKILSPLVK